MSSGNKRVAPDGGHDDDDDRRLGVRVPETKRRVTLKNAVRNIIGVGGLSLYGTWLKFEPMIRSCVREEVERAILSSFHPSSRSSLNQIEPPRGRSLQLRFVNKLPSTIFTGSKVEAEDGNAIKIILFDANSERKVSSGSLSCIKVEIVALNGDFGADEREDWTENEFNANVLREREGRRPLVTGDLNITMTGGGGTVDNVIFTDNSSWIRSRKFRLGAKIVQRNSGEVIIQEARSEAFVVKDHRGELYKKHHPPRLQDEVWRLERIAKDGAFHKRLTSKNIHNVKDFLRLHITDPSELRDILGGISDKISDKVWDKITKHSFSCVLDDDDEWFTYYGTVQRPGLLLNSIYRVVAATFDGQIYQPVEKLDSSQKLLVEDAKRQAYRNVQDLVMTDKRAIMASQQPEPISAPNLFLQQPADYSLTTQGTINSFSSQLPEPISAPNLFLQQPADCSLTTQDQPDIPLSFDQSSTSYANDVVDNTQLQVPVPQDGQTLLQALNPMLRNSFRLDEFFPYNGDSNLSLLAGDDHFASADNCQTLMPSWNTVSSTCGQGSGFYFTNPDLESSAGILPSPNFNVHIQRMGVERDVCTKAGWLKIQAVIKWRSIRRGATSRRHWLPEGLCV